MARYRTKPCEIEALLFEDSDESVCSIMEFTNGNFAPYGTLEHYEYAVVKTLEGNMRAELGDYIIRGLRGEYYPCKPDVFHKKYEAVE
ncbi:hypothetical protein B5F53_11840 [Blautia sp. An249]|uniref:hypothetical protein n=1 Tax=Blautia sp. An249 TaxID=1965603 RepID=UPI000B3992B2|nr:hypothetical protein [Blautia sp. An249]OUO77900.1 hypothetical protein B5F53_11840 [Blautia sp. An249]